MNPINIILHYPNSLNFSQILSALVAAVCAYELGHTSYHHEEEHNVSYNRGKHAVICFYFRNLPMCSLPYSGN